MLDIDGSGEVTVNEFITCMFRLIYCNEFQHICLNTLQMNHIKKLILSRLGPGDGPAQPPAAVVAPAPAPSGPSEADQRCRGPHEVDFVTVLRAELRALRADLHTRFEGVSHQIHALQLRLPRSGDQNTEVPPHSRTPSPTGTHSPQSTDWHTALPVDSRASLSNPPGGSPPSSNRGPTTLQSKGQPSQQSQRREQAASEPPSHTTAASARTQKPTLALANGRPASEPPPCADARFHLFDVCIVVRVSGAGYEPVNGDYSPILDNRNHPAYGKRTSEAIWPGYQNCHGAQLTWYWEDDAYQFLRGWGFIHHGQHRYFDSLHRLQPLQIPNDAYIARDGYGADPVPLVTLISSRSDLSPRSPRRQSNGRDAASSSEGGRTGGAADAPRHVPAAGSAQRGFDSSVWAEHHPQRPPGARSTSPVPAVRHSPRAPGRSLSRGSSADAI